MRTSRRAGRLVDARVLVRSPHPSQAQRRAWSHSSSAYPLEEIGFARSAAVHHAEHAIERLHTPQRIAVLRRKALELCVDAHLRLVAGDGPPHGFVETPRVDRGCN